MVKLLNSVRPYINYLDRVIDSLHYIVGSAVGEAAHEYHMGVLNTIITQQGGASPPPDDVSKVKGPAMSFVGGTTPEWLPLKPRRVLERQRSAEERWKTHGSPKMFKTIGNKPMLIETGALMMSITLQGRKSDRNTRFDVGVFNQKEARKAAALEMGSSYRMKHGGGSEFGKIVMGDRFHKGIAPRSFLLSTMNRMTGYLYKKIQNSIQSKLEAI